MCSGAFLLAAAGLLDGRRATTHWAECALLEQSYPKVTVEPDAIYVNDGNVWTSAGVTAGIASPWRSSPTITAGPRQRQSRGASWCTCAAQGARTSSPRSWPRSRQTTSRSVIFSSGCRST
ncbi:DJ-1/PfpI family protein [Glaciibacter sp. 2TAF33]|uniref:DJ-1/PfpI family protein n=1 Tax=Glaciibacter sp. 2TAF33 TaxID=3233015 RepID=UPI003F8D9E31